MQSWRMRTLWQAGWKPETWARILKSKKPQSWRTIGCLPSVAQGLVTQEWDLGRLLEEGLRSS